MAKTSELFRQSDVTVWGILALVACGVAVMSANVSALLPHSVLTALHQSRLEAPTLNQLRRQVSDMREQTQALTLQNAEFANRFALQEQRGADVTHRVAALEVSVPNLLEASPPGPAIDRTTLTAAVNAAPDAIYDVDGGSVAVRNQPLEQSATEAAPNQPLPEPVTALDGAAIGPLVTADTAADTWSDLSMKLGPLLLGFDPRLTSSGDESRIIVGPMAQTDVEAFCQQLEGVSIPCIPGTYQGVTLNP